MTERQQEIIDKAIEIIAGKGIQNLTIKNLSKAINVTEPAIYRHFENKMEILITMLNNLDEFTKQFTENILKENISPLQKLEKILLSYFDAFAKHPYWASVIFSDEIFKNEEVLTEKIQAMLAKKEECYLKLIAKAQRKGEVRKDVTKQHLTLVIMGALRLLIKRWELSGFSFDLKKEGKKLLRSLMQIIKS